MKFLQLYQYSHLRCMPNNVLKSQLSVFCSKTKTWTPRICWMCLNYFPTRIHHQLHVYLSINNFGPMPDQRLNPQSTEIFIYLNQDTKGFFKFESIINVLVSSSRFIWTPMSWVYGHYNILLFQCGDRHWRQILTSKVAPRAERVKRWSSIGPTLQPHL